MAKKIQTTNVVCVEDWEKFYSKIQRGWNHDVDVLIMSGKMEVEDFVAILASKPNTFMVSEVREEDEYQRPPMFVKEKYISVKGKYIADVGGNHTDFLFKPHLYLVGAAKIKLRQVRRFVRFEDSAPTPERVLKFLLDSKIGVKYIMENTKQSEEEETT